MKRLLTIALLLWDNNRQQLTIGQREGHYEGMPATRLFHIRLVGGTTQSCLYTGQPTTISFGSDAASAKCTRPMYNSYNAYVQHVQSPCTTRTTAMYKNSLY